MGKKSIEGGWLLMMKKGNIITMSMSVILFLLIIIVLRYPWSVIRLGTWYIAITSQNPPTPEIEYGEFPFKLEYEINGKRVLYQDTLIVRYDGIEITESGDKELRWKSEWEKDGMPGELLWIDDSHVINYIGVRAGSYYMGDYSEYKPDTKEDNFILVWTGAWDSSVGTEDKYEDIGGGLSEDELWSEFGIKIIREELPDRLKNKFTTKK